MRLRLVICALLAVAATSPAPAGAIVGGQADGNRHPYVGLLDDGTNVCTGTLISPTVLVTAAHCFSGSRSLYGTNTSTGATVVRVTFDPRGFDVTAAERASFFGGFYADPQFCLGCKGDPHDLAVVVFTGDGCAICAPVPVAATLGRYGILPPAGLGDTLRPGTPVDLVGYGIQNFVHPRPPCGGPCRPVPGEGFTRQRGAATLTSVGVRQGAFAVGLRATPAGPCYADSGAPTLVAGSDVMLAVITLAGNELCRGVATGYRLDTPAALAFVTGFMP